MLVFETILALLLGATILSGGAKRLNIPYPTLLALAGAAVAFLRGAPRLDLPPEPSATTPIDASRGNSTGWSSAPCPQRSANSAPADAAPPDRPGG